MGCVFYPGGIPDYFRLSKTEVPFAIPHKTKAKGGLTAKATVEPGLNPKQRYYLTGSLNFFAVKVPLCLCLMRNCEGNFRTEEQKTENRRVFGCAFPKMGTGNSDDSGMSLEK